MAEGAPVMEGSAAVSLGLERRSTAMSNLVTFIELGLGSQSYSKALPWAGLEAVPPNDTRNSATGSCAPLLVRETSLLLALAREWARDRDIELAASRWLRRFVPPGSAPSELHLYLEAPCIQACEFCPVPALRVTRLGGLARRAVELRQRSRLDLVASGAFEALVRAMARSLVPVHFTLTGYDWARHPARDHVLDVLERQPLASLRLQGPSTALRDDALAGRVAALPGLRAVAFTLQSSDPGTHDASVGVAGAGAAIHDAIRTLAEHGVPLEPSLVITERSLPTLSDTLRWAAARDLRITITSYWPDLGAPSDARPFASFADVRRALERVSMDRAARDGVASLVGLPRCVVPDALRSLAYGSPEGDRRESAVHPEATCGQCTLRVGCGGVPATYAARLGLEGLGLSRGGPDAPSVDTSSAAKPRASGRRGISSLMILPPDYHAPVSHLENRFPPLGPAIVAAAIAPLGIDTRAVDVAAIHFRREAPSIARELSPEDVRAHLAGVERPDLALLLDDILRGLDSHRECDIVAISVDRGSQSSLVALLAHEIKRRWGKRIIVGGIGTHHVRGFFDRTGAAGPDIVTTASTPDDLREAFSALLAMPVHRRGPPIEPNTAVVQLGRKGMRRAPSAEGWPLPDFGIYDLELYRREVVPPELDNRPPSEARFPRALVLPYFQALECQFSCAFCQTGGNQETKSTERVVRELAELSERWNVGEFLFFDTQANLIAPGLSRALIDARLDIRWSDSYRVRPRGLGDLELMARAGCASITVGVESGSDRVLKAMVKGHASRHASEMVREAHSAEMMLRVNILTCFPTETRSELQETCDWVEAHADCIDDLAPSSFYLTADSPVGREPERFGVTIRDPRELTGPTKFRKSPDALTYDEVGGMRWEEREPMLQRSEEMVHEAWRRGRGAGPSSVGLSPSSMLVLRRHFSTKSELRAALERYCGGDEAPPPALTTMRPRIVGDDGAGRDAASRLRALVGRGGQSMRDSVRPGSTVHALLFGDGRGLLFKGTVRRAARRRSAAEIEVEEVLVAFGVDWPARFVADVTDDAIAGRELGVGERTFHAAAELEIVSFVLEPNA